MINLKLAETYANAIFDIAVEQQNLEQIEADLLYVNQVFDDHAELSSFVESPVVDASAKIALLQELFGEINQMAARLLYIMIERGRANCIESAIEQFVIRSREARGIVEAKVRVASKMSPETEAKLKARLEEVTGKTILLDIDEDPAIIGGLVVNIGDKQIDASISQRLKGLKNVLLDDNTYRKAQSN